MTDPTIFRARSVAASVSSVLANRYEDADLVDAFAVDLPLNATDDVEVLARFILGSAPPLVAPLMAIRDRVMGRFGIKTSREIAKGGAQRGRGVVGSFPVQSSGSGEIVLGEDDRHLDFRLALRFEAEGASRRLSLVSVVQCHNLLGRAYLAAIAPFHRRIVPAYLNRASRRGWPLR